MLTYKCACFCVSAHRTAYGVLCNLNGPHYFCRDSVFLIQQDKCKVGALFGNQKGMYTSKMLFGVCCVIDNVGMYVSTIHWYKAHI